MPAALRRSHTSRIARASCLVQIPLVLYLCLLVAIALDRAITPASIASSPIGVIHGHVMAMLTSGLVIDGPAAPQIFAVTLVLVAAQREFGVPRAWGLALAAHVGATVTAYTMVWWLGLTDHHLVASVLHAPDFGISVILAGELGALAQRRRPHLAAAGTLLLSCIAGGTLVLSGTVGPPTLASLEHLLGFVIGAICAMPLTFGSLSRERTADLIQRSMRILEVVGVARSSAPQPATASLTPMPASRDRRAPNQLPNRRLRGSDSVSDVRR
jgi:hypothetical protein